MSQTRTHTGALPARPSTALTHQLRGSRWGRELLSGRDPHSQQPWRSKSSAPTPRRSSPTEHATENAPPPSAPRPGRPPPKRSGSEFGVPGPAAAARPGLPQRGSTPAPAPRPQHNRQRGENPSDETKRESPCCNSRGPGRGKVPNKAYQERPQAEEVVNKILRPFHSNIKQTPLLVFGLLTLLVQKGVRVRVCARGEGGGGAHNRAEKNEKKKKEVPDFGSQRNTFPASHPFVVCKEKKKN